MHKKMKMTQQRAENLVHVQQHHSVSFYKKNIFPILIYIADIAILMSDFDIFDTDQMSSNFAQRQNFVKNFHCKKISFIGNLEDAENAFLHFFIVHPIFNLRKISFKMRPIPALQLKRFRNGIKKHKEWSNPRFLKNVILSFQNFNSLLCSTQNSYLVKVNLLV